MPLTRTSRAYGKLPDLEVSAFAGVVISGLTGNAELAAPPVDPKALTTLKRTFDDAIIAAAEGGTLATAHKRAARAALVTALNKNASYVDIHSDEDLTVLLSSGYETVSTNRAQTVLNPPAVIRAEHGQTGEIRLRVKGDPNRKAVLGRCKTMDGDWGPVLTFKNSRSILFDGLKAGTTYVMQLCGIGGSTGQSDWSQPFSKMAL
jgi:hypothetical protein